MCAEITSDRQVRNPRLGEVRALCFDLGNTLIEFGPRQMEHQFEELKRTLMALFGRCDEERLREVRKGQIVAPYRNGYREADLHDVSAELIRELYQIEPEAHQVVAMAETRYHAFVEVVELADDVQVLLHKLGERYRLALLSNYPCGKSIRDGLAKLEMTAHFEVIVISGEVGFVKPHRRPYEVLLEGLNLRPEECVYVGDNWLADVQGAKRIGMKAVLTTQHLPYERFEPEEGDHQPDLRIEHLGELEEHFLRSWS